MKIHELQVAAAKDSKRVGRGIGSGYGKTAGRGTKGQNARAGGGVRPGFEGGQNPLAKRIPKKRGFVPHVRSLYQVVNVSQLESFKAGSKIDVGTLAEAGLVKHIDKPVKLLGQGKLTKKLTITIDAASKSAADQVKAAGGTVETISKQPQTAGL